MVCYLSTNFLCTPLLLAFKCQHICRFWKAAICDSIPKVESCVWQLSDSASLAHPDFEELPRHILKCFTHSLWAKHFWWPQGIQTWNMRKRNWHITPIHLPDKWIPLVEYVLHFHYTNQEFFLAELDHNMHWCEQNSTSAPVGTARFQAIPSLLVCGWTTLHIIVRVTQFSELALEGALWGLDGWGAEKPHFSSGCLDPNLAKYLSLLISTQWTLASCVCF